MKNFFKKLFVVLFSAGAAVSLVACGNKQEGSIQTGGTTDNGGNTQTGGTTDNGGNTQTGGSTNNGNNNTGNNTEDSSITVAKAIELASALEASTGKENLHLSAETYVIKGVISGGIEAYNDQYKNATFNMKDANGTTEIVAFRLSYGDTSTKFSADTFAANIVEGKEVKVNGKLEKYQDKNGNIKLEIVNGFVVVEGGTNTPTPTPTPSPVTDDTATVGIVAGLKDDARYVDNGASIANHLSLPACVATATVTAAHITGENIHATHDFFVNEKGSEFRMYQGAQITLTAADGYKFAEVLLTSTKGDKNSKHVEDAVVVVSEDGKTITITAQNGNCAYKVFQIKLAK